MPVLPVEALSAAGVIVGLGYGFRWLFKEWQEFRNDGKVQYARSRCFYLIIKLAETILVGSVG